MPSLNVIALLSGGKDSFFSMLHCLEHGHRIVALANLHPVDDVIDDLDSFMYQTVGHTIIPLYQQALGLPLYRRAFSGHAVTHTRIYDHQAAMSGNDEDETEALVPLLRQIKSEHPEVNAVSTGAILSDYQRTRIESIALRLGLTPISYLWQYPTFYNHSPTALLEDMAHVGQDSRIIKVSSGGLDSTFLWENVANARTRSRLYKTTEMFASSNDGAVLGEGGEYETLTLSGPAPLWKGIILIVPEDMHVVSGDAGSASMRISNATVQPGAQPLQGPLPAPALLEMEFDNLFQHLVSEDWSHQTQHMFETEATLSKPGTCTVEQVDEQTIFLNNWTSSGCTVEEQTRKIVHAMRLTMKEHGYETSDIAYTSIVLRDMAQFNLVNPIYGTLFDRPNPPARATIACADVLQPGEQLSISLTCVKTSSDQRQGLHVQSISYWAPANIGPYSQAITVPGMDANSTVTYIAGQIPLVPATMKLDVLAEMPDETRFLHQAVLSLQHLHRIANAMAVRSWKHAIVFIVAPDVATAQLRAAIARRTWSAAHDQSPITTEADEQEYDDDFDVWHSQQSSRSWKATSSQTIETSRTATELVVIVVDSLPRNADIEWVVFGASSADATHELRHYRYLLDTFSARLV